MRFLLRALAGMALAAGLAAAGGFALVRSLAPEPPAPPAERAERVFAAPVAVLTRTVATPSITAFGAVRSWRTLQLRAAAPGRVEALADAFREGARIAAGDLLFRIDQSDYAARLADARLGVDEAEAERNAAVEGVRAAELELAAAETQAALRAASLERQTGLADRGFSASAAVEEARLAEAQAQQAVAGRAQALVAARSAAARAAFAVRRAVLARDEAARRLAETELRAPFDGVLTDAAAALGDVLAANQAVGALIDPTALEAELRVSAAEFARLLDRDGTLIRAPVTLTLALAERPLTVTGRLDRFGAAAGEAGAGRVVYARLEVDAATVLRPGDFVSARIEEPPLEDVAIVPAAAVTEDGRLLVLDQDDRLREVQTRILRRDGDAVVLAGAPFGARYVAARAPQLTPGVKVRGAPPPAPVAEAAPGAG